MNENLNLVQILKDCPKGTKSCFLIHGDCLSEMKNIPDGSIDMILCDLPYGTTKCSWDIIIPFDKLWEQYSRIIKDNGAIVLFGQEPFSSLLRCSNLKDYKYDIYWEKERITNIMQVKKRVGKNIETISVFYKNQCTYNHIDNGTRYPTQVWKFKRDILTSNLHPTQKPVALLEELIKTFSNEGDIILDNCMGSGSTGVACMNTNRNFIGIELDEKYFNIATERIIKISKQ